MRIAIIMDGGIVQEVITDESTEVIVVDRDKEGVDLEELKTVEGEDSYIYNGLTIGDVNQPRLDTIFKEAGRG